MDAPRGTDRRPAPPAEGAPRAARPGDAARLCEIYNPFVRDTWVTFEETPVLPPEMARRIADGAARWPWLVWEVGGAIAGYAYATPWRARSAYRHSVESTIYLAAESQGRGLGTRLYQALLDELRARDVHCVVGGIALPNAASVALHEKLGFTQVARFREIGLKLDGWRDVGYWQRVLS